MFNVSSEDYFVIFTSGATGALKLLADSFFKSRDNSLNTVKEIKRNKANDSVNFSVCTCKGAADENISKLVCFTEDNHTSAVGVVRQSMSSNTTCVCLKNSTVCELENLSENTDSLEPFCICSEAACSSDPDVKRLFLYPLQSNFNGRRYPQQWVELAQSGKLLCGSNWFVAVDAASFVATSPLDLSHTPADFIALSFYKIFGFPTGLGTT